MIITTEYPIRHPKNNTNTKLALLIAITSIATTVTATHASDDFTADIPVLVEQAQQAGVIHQYDGPWEYFVGGGVSTFDCNQDRLPDLFLAGGAQPAQLYVNQSEPGGLLKFKAIHSSHTSLKKVTGSYILDIDNDGHLDLVVLRTGANQLLKGGPDCSFEPANALWGYDGGSAWTTAFSASFEPGSQYPTLAFGNYVDRSAPGSPWGTCHENVLLRPSAAADGPLYSEPHLLSPGYCALSVLFTDWNKTGTDALRITNDRHYYRDGQEQLWRLDGGRYPRQYTASEGWAPMVIWGMGIAQADLNADGYPEYALTSMGDTKLQVLDLQQAIDENRPFYEDMAWTRGATAHRPYTGDDIKPSTGWHAQFEDINNDSFIDLFIAKGNVESMSDFAQFDPDNLLLGNHNGQFSEQGLAAGIALDRKGRGASVADLNADGLLDLVVVNRSSPVSLFRNAGMSNKAVEAVALHANTEQTAPKNADSTMPDATPATLPAGNWLKIELRQPGSNRNAIGARLSIKTGNHVQSRQVQVGGGHASGGIGFIHVGLGVAERAVVRVQWPDGQWSAPFKLFANHHVVIERDNNTIQQWFPINAQG